MNSLVAVDVGNTSIKVGYFVDLAANFPQPQATFSLSTKSADFSMLREWLQHQAIGDAVPWYVASVHEGAAAALVVWLGGLFPNLPVKQVTHREAPLIMAVQFPEKVGVDRLMAAVAANRLRRTQRPAIVVDAGTAITVDVVAPPGTFLGGAILPGMAMSAMALDRYTDKLPLVETHYLTSPAAIGNSTVPAMESGLFWGAVGAIRELVHRTGAQLGAVPEVFLTGGDAARLAPHLESPHVVAGMVLSGIAITALHIAGQAATADE